MIAHTHAVLLAGGSGTRFWPVSRTAKPKQFLDILGTGQSLLQASFARVRQLLPEGRIWLVGSQAHAALLREQLPSLAPERLLLEPLQRNTAPSILWAACAVAAHDPEAILWILPADHFIPEAEPFLALVRRILETCDFSEAIFTIGLKPKYPHTGYGYIQYVPASGRLCHPVKTFTEKPPRELAELFVQSGDFLWNSGMFLARASVLKSAFAKHAPDLYELFQNIDPTDLEAIRIALERAASISFDYAVMEKYHPVMVVEGDFAWWDLGGWNAVHELSPHDTQGNTCQAQVQLREVRDSLFYAARPDKLIIAEGLSGYFVIDTEDALLILPRSQEQNIREWVQRLRTDGQTEYL